MTTVTAALRIAIVTLRTEVKIVTNQAFVTLTNETTLTTRITAYTCQRNSMYSNLFTQLHLTSMTRHFSV